MKSAFRQATSSKKNVFCHATSCKMSTILGIQELRILYDSKQYKISIKAFPLLVYSRFIKIGFVVLRRTR